MHNMEGYETLTVSYLSASKAIMNGDIVDTTPASDLFLSNLQNKNNFYHLFPNCICSNGFLSFLQTAPMHNAHDG